MQTQQMKSPQIGHNKPPTPMEVCAAEFDDIISEAHNWADGELVENEAQMLAVDEIVKGLRTYNSKLKVAVKEHVGPAHTIWKGKVAEGKVYTDDADRLKKCLTDAVAPFKAKLAAEKEAARTAAWEEARRKEREAQESMQKANPASIEDARAVEEVRQAALDAKKYASATQKDTVKGMRKVTHHEVVDMRSLVNWIAANDKDAMAEFAAQYASKNHANIPNDIVNTWETREAY